MTDRVRGAVHRRVHTYASPSSGSAEARMESRVDASRGPQGTQNRRRENTVRRRVLKGVVQTKKGIWGWWWMSGDGADRHNTAIARFP